MSDVASEISVNITLFAATDLSLLKIWVISALLGFPDMAGDKDDGLQTPGDEVGIRIWPQIQSKSSKSSILFEKCQMSKHLFPRPHFLKPDLALRTSIGKLKLEFSCYADQLSNIHKFDER